MVRRLPACNPCRASKVSCDHARPVCQRCKEKNDAHACVYRSRPFKHNRALDTDNGNQTNTRIPENVPGTSKTLRHYPNPGYLGTSSHITLFEQLPSVRDTDGDISYTPLDTSSHFNEALNGQATTEKVEQGAALIKRLRADLNHRKCESLVLAWIETGINLPIAEPYTVACAAAAQNVLFAFSTTSEDDISSSKTLLNESVRPLNLDRDGTIEDFSRMFAAGSPRWETLGLYFTSISRATIDLVRFPRLFSSPGQRRALQESAMQCSDLCLDIALSIDCMNDLQLMLQYENFILHSLVDGDQSYHSWRRLGDVISSLFALGYHENLGNEEAVPAFQQDLRHSILCRAYSADKNCSIFLGRPPRMLRQYCPAIRQSSWVSNELFSYKADTWVHATCALLKEDVMHLRWITNHSNRRNQAREIEEKADEAWQALPRHFQLKESLSSLPLTAFELDFLVSVRLNFFHVQFLLYLTLQSDLTRPGVELIRVSSEMLSLIVKAIVSRHRLANSGTSLVWKVAYYGLAAAGVICLALLSGTNADHNLSTRPSIWIQDLSVLVAELEPGAFLQREDPNYALLSDAACTIQNLLNCLLANKFDVRHTGPNEEANHMNFNLSDGDLMWNPQGFQEFDPSFWLSLSEHPFLTLPEDSATAF